MKHKKIFSIFIFILIGIILFYILNIIFMPEWVINNDATLSTRGIYEEKKNSLDVVFVGSSNIYNGISPLEIWEETGIPSYSYASPEQKIWLSYYAIEELFKYQKPKIIMLDMNEAFTDAENNYDEDTIRKLLDNMKIGKAKLDAINDPNLDYSISDKISFLIPITRYHTRWDSLTTKDIERLFYSYDSAFKGYSYSKNIEAFEGNTEYLQYEEGKAEINQVALEYLEKIIKICEENNTELILIDMPSPNTWSYVRHKAVEEYANEKGIKFLELNCVEEINIDWSTDTQDKGWHLNVKGAEKVSKYISKYLKENYNLQNQKNNPKYSDWNKDLEKYLKQKNG